MSCSYIEEIGKVIGINNSIPQVIIDKVEQKIGRYLLIGGKWKDEYTITQILEGGYIKDLLDYMLKVDKMYGGLYQKYKDAREKEDIEKSKTLEENKKLEIVDILYKFASMPDAPYEAQMLSIKEAVKILTSICQLSKEDNQNE